MREILGKDMRNLWVLKKKNFWMVFCKKCLEIQNNFKRKLNEIFKEFYRNLKEIQRTFDVMLCHCFSVFQWFKSTGL